MTEWEQIKARLEDGLDDVFEQIIKLGTDEAWAEFVAAAEERYEAGRAEHAASDSTWTKWTISQYDQNITEELIDCTIYAAARRIREASES